MGNPKRHHTVPVFLLNGFTNPAGKLNVYDRISDSYREPFPKDATVESNFNTFIDKSGNKNYSIEVDIFAKDIEAKAASIVAKLLNNSKLSAEEKMDMCVFMAAQYLRTRAMRRDHDHLTELLAKDTGRMIFRDVDSAAAALKAYEQEHGIQFQVTPEEMVEFAEKGDYTVESDPQHHLESMLKNIPEISNLFNSMNFYIIEAPIGKSFITSDTPLHVARIGAHPIYGLPLEYAEITMPISPKYCIFLHKPGRVMARFIADERRVREINKRIGLNAEREIISHERKLLDRIVQVVKQYQQQRSPGIAMDSPWSRRH